MNSPPDILPATRSWREIPQHVAQRAMSPEGRKRRWMKLLRMAAGVMAVAATAWAAWQVAVALQSDPRSVPTAAKAELIGDHIALVTDGVLDRPWLVRTLALPKNETLMTLDPAQLRARVLASGQVATAAIIRNFPATLSVHISERAPVARIMAAGADGATRPLLVARDGVSYEGVGYDPAILGTLPWLDGVKLIRQGRGFAPIEGMGVAAELLSRAKFEAEHLYQTWQVVSLARLQQDGEIAVRTRDGMTVTFGTREDFFRQLARLDLLLDTVAKGPPGQAAVREVNLSFGAQVPVAFATPAPSAGPNARPRAVASTPPTFHIDLPH